jgi:hypothetical protein
MIFFCEEQSHRVNFHLDGLRNELLLLLSIEHHLNKSEKKKKKKKKKDSHI